MSNQPVKPTYTLKIYFLICFIPSFLYAVIRYNFFSDVPWSQIPLWVSNKAFAVTATLLIGCSLLLRSHHPRREIGILGAYIAFIHVILSLTLLTPSYYEKFYLSNGQFSLTGGLAMLAGVISCAAIILAIYHSFDSAEINNKLKKKFIQQFVLITLFFNFLHLITMGFVTWFTPLNWPGYLPPLSMLSALSCIYFISLRGKFSRAFSHKG